MPESLWTEYLDTAYHGFLPRLSAENRLFTDVMRLLNDHDLIYPGVVPGSHYDVFDRDGHFRNRKWAGAWDADIRLEEMDREGVAAEFVFNGYFRATDLFFNVSNTAYPPEVADAGVRAYDRWAYETFGRARDRLLLVGPVGRCLDMDETLRQARWIADHGFAGMYTPGFTSHPDLPPLYHRRWAPLWELCVDRGLVIVVHGGYGFEPGFSYESLASVYTRLREAGGSDEDVVHDLRAGLFNDQGFFADVRCRRAMWQLMLGGVFDRHPGLRVMMTEVRADWIPATLKYLDEIWEHRRDTLPARCRPSEYWQVNCLAGLSFMHRAEVMMRHEIGVETLSFGRDYPHTESTWPNTKDYLRTLLAGVPSAEARLILGGNLVRFLGLDPVPIERVAAEIGCDPAALLDPTVAVDPLLLAHLDARCGLSKPAEGGARLGQLQPLVDEDLGSLTGVGW